MNKPIFTADAPAPIGPYSQAVLAGKTLYCSGQIALDPKTGEFCPGAVEAQTRVVCENLKAVLRSVEMTFSDVVKTTCFLVNMDDFARFNAVYGEYFISSPARSCVAVKELPKGALVEVEMIAKVQK